MSKNTKNKFLGPDGPRAKNSHGSNFQDIKNPLDHSLKNTLRHLVSKKSAQLNAYFLRYRVFSLKNAKNIEMEKIALKVKFNEFSIFTAIIFKNYSFGWHFSQ